MCIYTVINIYNHLVLCKMNHSDCDITFFTIQGKSLGCNAFFFLIEER